MKQTQMANRLMLAVSIFFVAGLILKAYFRNNFYIGLYCFTLEAALIGGIADWFAVTALFKKPLGFPWHTAIIPNNRETIINAVQNVVENDLLCMTSIKHWIGNIKIVDRLIEHANHQEGSQLVDVWIDKAVLNTLKSIDTPSLSSRLEIASKEKLHGINISNLISSVIEGEAYKEQREKAIDLIIQQVGNILRKPQVKQEVITFIEKAVKREMDKTTGVKSIFYKLIYDVAREMDFVNIKDMAASLHESLLEILEDLKERDNPLRYRFSLILKDSLANSQANEQLMEWLETCKEAVIQNIEIHSSMAEMLTVEDSSLTMAILKMMKDHINGFLSELNNNIVIKEKLDERLKQGIYELIETYHHAIGQLVKDILQSFSDQDLNNFVIEKAGKDLQWIRINGSIVGGIVGMILFVLIHLFTVP